MTPDKRWIWISISSGTPRERRFCSCRPLAMGVYDFDGAPPSCLNIHRLSLLLFIEITMARRMLKLRQVKERANDIYVQQRFMIVACVAKAFGLMQVDAHGCDRRLNVLMAANALGE